MELYYDGIVGKWSLGEGNTSSGVLQKQAPF